MTEREIGELRRRFRPDRSGISAVCGCYISAEHAIVSCFRESLGLMPESDAERILSLFRKCFSGAKGKNLLDIAFKTSQVANGEEHALLSSLRNSGLKDDVALHTLYERIAPTVDAESGVMVIVAYDVHDVIKRHRDGEAEDESTETFPYIVCAVCEVKKTKDGIGYDPHDGHFLHIGADSVIASPLCGFSFPAFDHRTANIYGALYYTADASDNHDAFLDAVFRVPAPMPAAVQKQSFASVLSEALGDDSSLALARSVDTCVRAVIAEQKESKKRDDEGETVGVSRALISEILIDGGATPAQVETFNTRFDDVFGEGADLPPKNLTSGSTFRVETPEITIRVDCDHADLISTRIVDGQKCIVIRAEGDVIVNGIPVTIKDTE